MRDQSERSLILITGASGLLGSSLLMRAVGQNREVVGLCRRHDLSIAGAEIRAVDLTDSTATRKVIADLRPSAIIHCAAATNVDWCEDHPQEAAAINIAVSAHLAQLAKEINAQLIHISTDSIFDGERGEYSENDGPSPLNVYAQTKFQAEIEVLRYCPSALIARVNFYGWNFQNKSSLPEWVLDQLSKGNPVPGFTDVFFCPMLANDLAELLLAMLDRGLIGIYNVVGSERISKYEFAARLATLFGFDPARVIPTSIAGAQLRAPRPRDTALNTRKISSALGLPMPDIASGLQKFKALAKVSDCRHAQTDLPR
jgi:dTDP-4-dehydrorhamnose reductase